MRRDDIGCRILPQQHRNLHFRKPPGNGQAPSPVLARIFDAVGFLRRPHAAGTANFMFTGCPASWKLSMMDPPLDLHSPGKAGKESSWWMLMKAMLLTDICDVNTISEPLRAVELPVPVPADDKILINAIRKEDTDQHYLLKLKYSRHLWMEKEIKSVANAARSDVRDFLALAAEIPIVHKVQEFELAAADKALKQLTQARIKAVKVIRVGT